MLNTPNEWHNEDEIEEYADEDFSDDYGGDYGDDTDFGTLDDGEYEDGEYEDGAGEGEESNDDGNDDGGDGLKKKLIIGAVVFVVLLILFGGVFLAVKKMMNKPTEETTIETVADAGNAEASADGEVSIDIDDGTSGGGEEITIEEDGAEALGADGVKPAESADSSGLEIEADEESPTFANKPNDTDNVTVAIGDVGRKNPFAPIGGKAKQAEFKATNNDGLDFEVIEPPELEPEDESVTRLLETKVTGIMYDARRPSAIVNIDGTDQLVRIGDILSGFEFVAITKNKVVIRSDNNVYRASVGQPLNAEKITNPIEISNLETKFKGSVRR